MTPIKDTYAVFSVGEVESFLMTQPHHFDFKRGRELLVGLVLAKCSITEDSPDVGVGFRLSPVQPVHSKDRPSLSHLLANYEIDDRDADIVVGNDDWLSPVQISRLESRGKGATSVDRLLAVLKKKMLVQSDPRLQLAILMDETFELKYDGVYDYLANTEVPYGRVVLVGQIGPKPKLGQYQCVEVYPELAITEPVQIRMTG